MTITNRDRFMPIIGYRVGFTVDVMGNEHRGQSLFLGGRAYEETRSYPANGRHYLPIEKSNMPYYFFSATESAMAWAFFEKHSKEPTERRTVCVLQRMLPDRADGCGIEYEIIDYNIMPQRQTL
jgi:hypothetical protein